MRIEFLQFPKGAVSVCDLEREAIMKSYKLGEVSMGIVNCIKASMQESSGAQAYALLCALKKLSKAGEAYYYLGVYYLEYGKIYWGIHGRYYEGKVSTRRVRRNLRRALKYSPNDADVLLAMGESFQKERRFAQAKLYYDLAHKKNPESARILWCLMEANYLLGNYAEVSALFDGYDWNGTRNMDLLCWSRILAMYAAAQQGNRQEIGAQLKQIGDISADIVNADVASVCLLELHYLAGDYDGMREVYESHREDMAYVTSPCKNLIEEERLSCAQEVDIEREVRSSFTPLSLVGHFDW